MVIFGPTAIFEAPLRGQNSNSGYIKNYRLNKRARKDPPKKESERGRERKRDGEIK